MHRNTPEIKRNLRKCKTLVEQLASLNGAYDQDIAYILTAGPSMKRFWSERIREYLSDKLVIAIKQTYNLAPEITDFHLLNSWNYEPYHYEDRPIVIAERADGDPVTPGMLPDMLFHVSDPRDFRGRLATSLAFDKWTFACSFDRPWGPGIVYELAGYLAVHLGLSEIVIAGWDLGKLNSPSMPHFFDQGREGNDYQLANKPRIRPFEVGDIARSTAAFYFWLRSKGIQLYLASDTSLVDETVPRIPSIDADRSISYTSHVIEPTRDSDSSDDFIELWDAKPDRSHFSSTGEFNEGYPVFEIRALPSQETPTVLRYSFRFEDSFREAVLVTEVNAKCTSPSSLSLCIDFDMNSETDEKTEGIRRTCQVANQWTVLRSRIDLCDFAWARQIVLSLELSEEGGGKASFCSFSADLVYASIMRH